MAAASMEALLQMADKYFKITERGSTLRTEFRAGTATFMTMCYILAGTSPSRHAPHRIVTRVHSKRRNKASIGHQCKRVQHTLVSCAFCWTPPFSFLMLHCSSVNSRLLSESGGPCECSEETRADLDCVFYDTDYDICVEMFRRELVTVDLCHVMCM